ncbi:hypothetical protein ACE7GA_09975 [Roseomonas sp. CCTCC AB2023176]|uniref:hypothetical protein n=1 Tax=Roseomonas sp. CCTCC AB2023176 TaxID=3342640 RepID=UPI0035D5DB86
MPRTGERPMYAAVFLLSLLLAICAGEAAARRVEARASAAEPRRDCVALGYAAVESIVTEGLPRGRDLTGAGFLHVAALRNRLARPLEVEVTFEASEASAATREGASSCRRAASSGCRSA